MRKTLWAALAMLASGTLPSLAVQAYPGLIPHTQPDGSVMMVKIQGDEFSHRFLSADNTPLTLDRDGLMRTATAAEIMQQEQSLNNAAMLRSAMRGPGVKGSATMPHMGTVRNVVILVQFSDVKFTTSNPQQYFTRWLNEEGFSDNGAIGSVRDYFVNNSEGQFTPQFDVYGPVTMSYNRAKNAATNNFYNVVKDATSQLDSQINFANYDNNNDGFIDNVYIIVAGQGGNYSGNSSHPWAHNSDVGSTLGIYTTRDGKKLYHYAMCSELGYDTSRPDGIGTFVHEYGHVLGLADHYNTASGGDYTPGAWDVMDKGNYLDNSRRPCNYSAYQRMALDWASPAATLSDSPATVTLCGMDTKPFFVKIETGRTNDYYLLENRVKTRFDNYLYGDGGMLIWHIDAGYSALDTKPNDNNSHLAVELMKADNKHGSDTYENIANDVFPGGSGNTTFSGSSSPTMFRWESSSSTSRVTLSDRAVTNITRSSDSNHDITFNFRGGSSTNVISPYPTTPRHDVSVQAQPAHGGTVYIGSDRSATSASLEEGTSLKIVAEPASGYSFVNWSRGGSVVSTSASATIGPMSASLAGTYVATFSRTDGQTDYCYPSGNLNVKSDFGTRYTSKLTVEAGDATTEIGPLQTSASSPLYCDQSLQTVTVEPGTTITITPDTKGAWMHSYFYIDWAGDGFNYTTPSDYVDPNNGYKIKSGSDLVFYSNWCPKAEDPSASNPWYTSLDTFFDQQYNHNFTPTTPFSITIPAGTKAGKYRARYKCHWQSLDPCGNADANYNDDNSLARMGGIVADFTIEVKSSAPVQQYNLRVAAIPSDGGTVCINGDSSLKSAMFDAGSTPTVTATANAGYKFTEWRRNGATMSTSATYTILPLSGNDTYSAIFTQADDDYCYPEGNLAVNSSFGTRYTSKLTVETADATTEIGPLQNSGSAPLYYDQSLQTVTVEPGATITITPDTQGSWMHSYFYIDWQNDGFNYSTASDYLDPDNGYKIKPGSELMFYSNWCPTNADPSSTNPWYTSLDEFFDKQYPHNFTPSTPFTITIPADAKAGKYRARYKCHWQSLDPCGNADVNTNSDNTLAHMGGIVADFTIEVKESSTVPVTYAVSAKAEPADAGVVTVNGSNATQQITAGSSVAFAATANQGYVFVNWTAPDGSEASAVSNFTINSFVESQQGEYTARFDTVQSSLTELDTESGATVVYDLQGRRVESPSRPGLYIINGRKVHLR